MSKTNRRNQRRRTHHPVVTVIVIFLLVGVLFFVSKMLADNTSDGTEDNKKNTTEITKTEKTEKAPTETQAPKDEDDQKTPIQNDGDDPNTKDSLTMSEVTGEILHIRLNIDQYLSSGTCNLTLTSSYGTTFTDNANIVPSPSTSTCEGFDIATSDLASGTWAINIDLESGGKTGTITGEVNL